MSVPKTDRLGNALTAIEAEIARSHEQLVDLLKLKDLSPAVRSGIAHAVASTFQVLNGLNIEVTSPPEI
jgi:hypothetical protein